MADQPIVPKIPLGSAAPVVDTPASVRALIDKHFALTDAARAALTKNLAARTNHSVAFAKRAQVAFADFKARPFPAAAGAGKTFLKPGDDLKKVQAAAVARGLAARQDPTATHMLRLAASSAMKKLVNEGGGSTSEAVGSVDPQALLDYVNARSRGLQYAARDGMLTQCAAEVEAQRRMQAITGGANGGAGGDGAKTDAPKDPLADLSTDELVKRSVDVQMATVTPPEMSLRYSSPDGSEQMQKAIASFELRTGPSDVTSYHDFNNLQIAFENVWTQVFDERVKDLGRQLYEEYVRLKDFTGTDTGVDGTISSVDELQALMDEIRSFADATIQNVGPVAQGTDGSSTGSGRSGTVTGQSGGGNVTATEVILDVLNPVQGVVDLIAHLF
jgi:hypothetical protein